MIKHGYCSGCGGVLSFYFIEDKTIFFCSMANNISLQQEMYDSAVYSCRYSSPTSVSFEPKKKLVNTWW